MVDIWIFFLLNFFYKITNTNFNTSKFGQVQNKTLLYIDPVSIRWNILSPPRQSHWGFENKKTTYISIQRKRAFLDSPLFCFEASTKFSHSFVEVLSRASAKKITNGKPRALYFGKFFVVSSFWNDKIVKKK